MISRYAFAVSSVILPFAIPCSEVLATELAASTTMSDARFDFSTVVAEARSLATRPYVANPKPVPPYFLGLDYDRFRDIRFRPEKAQWADGDSAFRAHFFHPGLFHDRTVTLHEIDDGKVTPIPYDKNRYDFGRLVVPPDTKYPDGYAGFRWHGEVNTPGVWDEFAVFVGASYFRCVPTGCGATYGLSARGLAVNTAAPGISEDFPAFTRVWLEKPERGARSAVAYALLDSPFVTGAYRFEIFPGRRVVTKVRVALFVRKKITRLGIAPFSSMFWYGENSRVRPGDFRPEVHDSDGLLIEERGGRRHWRPLLNDRKMLRHSVFSVGDSTGFGLRQRDLSFGNYEDLEAMYHRRPGAWVVPGAGWPAGAVHLFELPTGEETWDNVVAYWQPDRIPEPGESLKFEYDIIWALEPEFVDPLARVLSTHVGDREGRPDVARHVIDFSRGADGEPPVLRHEASGDAEVVYSQIYKNSETGGWRVILDVAALPPADSPRLEKNVSTVKSAARHMNKHRPVSEPSSRRFAEQSLRVWLERDGKDVSERWDYRPGVIDVSVIPSVRAGSR